MGRWSCQVGWRIGGRCNPESRRSRQLALLPVKASHPVELWAIPASGIRRGINKADRASHCHSSIEGK